MRTIFLFLSLFAVTVCQGSTKIGSLDLDSVFAGKSSIDLVRAINRNSLREVRSLLRKGIDPNEPGKLNITPVWWAIARGNPPIIEELLRSGGNPNVAPENSRTSMAIAVSKGDLAVLKLLLEYKADLELRDSDDQRTPIFDSALMNNIPAMQLLISSGANIEAKSEHGYTPLLFATMSNSLDAALKLIDAGADLQATSDHGATVKSILLRMRAEPNTAHYRKRLKILDHFEASSNMSNK